jgi:hypothetical protein
MTKKLFKIYWLVLVLFVGCRCGTMPGNNVLQKTPTEPQIESQKYYNLEVIDLDIEAKDNLSFEFNDKSLIKEGDLYLSEDLMVYLTKEDKWQATVVGKGGINSRLKISAGQNLLKEVGITTTNEVFGYQDELGKEWPGMHNIGNTCFANVVYKLIARCSGFDNALSNDTEDSINTLLRNIVNGIRLGKRSALQEQIVNNKISKLFLDKLTEKSGRIYNCKAQEDSGEFFYEIEQLLYPTSPITVDLVSPELDNLINESKREKPAFKYIVKEEVSGEIYEMSYLSSAKVAAKCLSLPRFFMYKSSGLESEKEKKVLENLQIPLWDYKTNKKLEEKTYKLIGLAYHLGSSTDSGHYVAYINFNEHGWYEHNDSRVTPVGALQSLTTAKLITVYELQD